MMFGLTSPRAPQARLDETRFITFFDLDIAELIATMALCIILPLFTFGMGLPPVLFVATIVSWPLWAGALFFVKRDGRNAAYWLGKLIPFWLRQRTFVAERPSFRVTPLIERLDDVFVTAPNAISYQIERERGGLVVHLYEEPLTPYRGWIAARGRSIGTGRITLP
jgi:hypothetical protein